VKECRSKGPPRVTRNFTPSFENGFVVPKTTVSQFVSLRDVPGSVEYYVQHLVGDQPQRRAISVRNSKRWLRCLPLPNENGIGREYEIPYIDNLGRFTGHTIYRWACEPQVALATIISTVARKLLSYSRKHNKWWVVKKHFHSIVKAAYVYSISKNLWFWDRVLFFCRNLQSKGSLVHKYALKFLCKTDDNIRFVYSQVCLQTNWLLSQAKRPCDKSALNEKRPSPLTHLGGRRPGLIKQSNAIVKALDRALSFSF